MGIHQQFRHRDTPKRKMHSQIHSDTCTNETYRRDFKIQTMKIEIMRISNLFNYMNRLEVHTNVQSFGHQTTNTQIQETSPRGFTSLFFQ